MIFHLFYLYKYNDERIEEAVAELQERRLHE